MTRLEALKEVAEKVEAGVYDVRAIRAVWPFREGYDDPGSDACYVMKDGSLDAALALHEAVLPGWFYVDLTRRGQRWTCLICRAVDDEPGISASNHVSARAWLLSILKALIAQEEAQ